MFFSRIGPFRIVWRKKNFSWTFSQGDTRSCHRSHLRAQISPEVEKESMSGFLLLLTKFVLHFLTKNYRNLYCTFWDFLQKPPILTIYVDFPERGIFFRGETFFSCFISILSRFWPKFSKIWWVISKKSVKNLNFDRFSWILRGTRFFFENRASSLKIVYSRLTRCKKSERSNGGKYENSVGQTDWQTDGLTDLVT